MKSKSAFASSLIFAASGLCFFFPFVTVSCSTQKLLTLTGAQLVTGTTINEPRMYDSDRTREVRSNPWAVVAAACAFVGLAFSFARPRLAIVSAVSGALGVVSLLVMKTGLDNEALRNGNGLLQLNYEPGFFLAFLFLVAGAVWNAYIFSQREDPSPPVPQAASQPPPAGDGLG